METVFNPLTGEFDYTGDGEKRLVFYDEMEKMYSVSTDTLSEWQAVEVSPSVKIIFLWCADIGGSVIYGIFAATADNGRSYHLPGDPKGTILEEYIRKQDGKYSSNPGIYYTYSTNAPYVLQNGELRPIDHICDFPSIQVKSGLTVEEVTMQEAGDCAKSVYYDGVKKIFLAQGWETGKYYKNWAPSKTVYDKSFYTSKHRLLSVNGKLTTTDSDGLAYIHDMPERAMTMEVGNKMLYLPFNARSIVNLPPNIAGGVSVPLSPLPVPGEPIGNVKYSILINPSLSGAITIRPSITAEARIFWQDGTAPESISNTELMEVELIFSVYLNCYFGRWKKFSAVLT